MKIVCLDALTLGDLDLSIFNKLGIFESYKTSSQEEAIERLKDADIVITNKVLINKELMDKTKLKLICVSATGMNNVDLNYAKEKGIEVKNVAGYSTNSVVQQTFASLLALTNSVLYYDNYCKAENGWRKSEIFTHLDKGISELAGKNFGIIGLGEIGTKVADIAKAFGSKVYYYSISGRKREIEYQELSLDELLKTCDIVSIHCALSEKTENLLSKAELAKMKDGAILMNFGRGKIIDEVALAKAIDEKNLKVALDVFAHEPIEENNPLFKVKKQENMILSPHVAWASYEARENLLQKLYKNVEDFLNK